MGIIDERRRITDGDFTQLRSEGSHGFGLRLKEQPSLKHPKLCIFHHLSPSFTYLSIFFLKFIIADLGMQWDAIREFRCLHQKAPATLWDGFPRQRQGKDHITQVPPIFAHLFGRHWSRFSSFPEWKSRDKHIAKTNNLLLA